MEAMHEKCQLVKLCNHLIYVCQPEVAEYYFKTWLRFRSDFSLYFP